MKKTIFKIMGEINSNKLIYITIGISTLFQLVFVFGNSFHFLLLNILPDDAFYYFNIARNIVTGFGSTFDGVNINNGYHPLWMLMLLPIFKLFSAGGVYDLAPIYTALTFTIIFSTLTSIYLAKILNIYTDNNYIKAFVIFAWAFNPYVFYAQLNGLETSLTLFTLVYLSYILFKLENFTRNVAIKIGIVSGILILCRLDMIFVSASVFLYLIYQYLNKNNLNNFVISALCTAIIFLTWQIYNYQIFGMLFTTASVTGTYVNHFLTYSDNGGINIFVIVKTVVYMFDRALIQLVETLGASYIYLGLVGIATYFLFRDYNFVENFKNKKMHPVFFIAFGLLILMFVSASVRWSFRTWYFIPHILIFTGLIFYSFENLAREFGNRKFNLFLLILFFSTSAFYFIAWEKHLHNREIMQHTIYKAVIWQNENLPLGSKIGSFNAGIQGYFTSHKLVNLDGLVNKNASEYMMKQDMWNYIKNVENLDYISDFPQYFDYRYKLFFGIPVEQVLNNLEIIHSETSNGNTLNTYKIKN